MIMRELRYESPSLEVLGFYAEGFLCLSGVVLDSEHDGFVGDNSDPEDLW